MLATLLENEHRPGAKPMVSSLRKGVVLEGKTGGLFLWEVISRCGEPSLSWLEKGMRGLQPCRAGEATADQAEMAWCVKQSWWTKSCSLLTATRAF